MKFKLTLYYIFFVSPGLIFGQNYKVGYRLSFPADTLTPETKSHEDFLLFVAEKESIFLSNLKYVRDSVLRNAKNQGMAMADLKRIFNNTPKGHFDFVLRKDNATSSYIYSEKISKSFTFEHPIANYRWKLSQNKKSIHGFDCRMAVLEIGGYNYLAWYAPEISLKNGPFLFEGLPGLVLELECPSKNFIFSFLGIEKLKEGEYPIIEFSSAVHTNNLQKYNSLRNSWRRNYASNAANNGQVSNGGSDPASFNNFMKNIDDQKWEYYKANNFEFPLF